jgi:hypothetical protein
LRALAVMTALQSGMTAPSGNLIVAGWSAPKDVVRAIAGLQAQHALSPPSWFGGQGTSP